MMGYSSCRIQAEPAAPEAVFGWTCVSSSAGLTDQRKISKRNRRSWFKLGESMRVCLNGSRFMMARFLSLLLVLGVCIWAQENRFPSDPERTVAQTTEESDSSSGENEPTPKEKAKELLESAAELVAAASPEVHVTGLIHLADNYRGV